MLKAEGSHPEYFDELCALAAGGQISEAELDELLDHIEQCARCRSAHADFVDLVHNRLPLVDPEITGSGMPAGFFSENSSYRERFLVRARKQGLAVSQASWRDTFRSKLRLLWWPAIRYAQAATLAIGLLLVTLGVLGYSLHQSNARAKVLAVQMSAISDRIRPLVSPGSPPSQESQPGTRLQAETARAAAPALPSRAASDAELAQARQDHAAAEARSKDLEAQLRAAAFELESLRAQHKEASD